MSSKNARKKDAADKYLERKIKALDQTEERLRMISDGYKVSHREAVNQNYQLKSENTVLTHKIAQLEDQVTGLTDLVGKLAGLSPEGIQALLTRIEEESISRENARESFNRIMSLSGLRGF